MKLFVVSMILFAVAVSIVVQCVSIYLFFMAFLTPKRNKTYFMTLITISLSAMKLTSESFSVQQRLIVFVMILMTSVFLFFHGTIAKKIYHVILYSFIMTVSELFYYILLRDYGHSIQTEEVFPFILYTLLNFLPLLIVFALSKCLHFFTADHAIGLSGREYLLLGVPPFLSLLSVSKMSESDRMPEIALVVIVNICIMLIYNNLAKKSFLLQQYAVIEQQNKYQEDILGQQRELVRLKHDLKNVLINFDLCLQENNIDRAKAQLKMLLHTSSLAHDIRTGCLPIDAIVNQKANQMKRLQIQTKFDLQIPSECNTDNIAVDLAAILGNVLDNAIEATQRVHTAKEKEIAVHMAYRDEKLYIHIINPSNERKQDFSQRIVMSEKASNRIGIGISSVKERVDRLKGYYDFKYETGFFQVLIILPVQTL